MVASNSNALTTPSVWDISLVEGAGLETLDDLYIVIKTVLPQPNIQIDRRDEATYRVRLPYCSKQTSLVTKFGEYSSAVTIISAAADLSLDQTKRLAELRARTLQNNLCLEVVPVKFERLPLDTGLQFRPIYSTYGRVGLDLYAYLPLGTFSITLYPRKIGSVSAGIKIKIPLGYEGQIRSLPWLAENHGVTVLNSPGSIDAAYNDVVKVVLINHGDSPYEINYCANIAQLVLVKVSRIAWTSDDESEESEHLNIPLLNHSIKEENNHVSVITRYESHNC